MAPGVSPRLAAEKAASGVFFAHTAGPEARSPSHDCRPMTPTELFLVAMLIIFSAPFLIWRLGRTDYHAPLVVIQILAGILLGPGMLGAIFPGYYACAMRASTTSQSGRCSR